MERNQNNRSNHVLAYAVDDLGLVDVDLAHCVLASCNEQLGRSGSKADTPQILEVITSGESQELI